MPLEVKPRIKRKRVKTGNPEDDTASSSQFSIISADSSGLKSPVVAPKTITGGINYNLKVLSSWLSVRGTYR